VDELNDDDHKILIQHSVIDWPLTTQRLTEHVGGTYIATWWNNSSAWHPTTTNAAAYIKSVNWKDQTTPNSEQANNSFYRSML